MKIKNLRYLFYLSFWRSRFLFFRAMRRNHCNKCSMAIDDLKKILSNPYPLPMLNLVHGELGICYAKLRAFSKAEHHLLLALEHERNHENGLACMWLGYIYWHKNDFHKSKSYFTKAQALGQSGLDKLVVNEEYVSKMIDRIDNRYRRKTTK